jgi:hypothetical protein
MLRIGSDDSPFEYIQFDFLSMKSMQIISRLGPSFIEILNGSIWERLLARLLIDVSQLGPIVKCPYQPKAPLDGIIAYLIRESGGNVVDTGVVDMAASSIFPNTGYQMRNKPIASLPVHSMTNGVSQFPLLQSDTKSGNWKPEIPAHSTNDQEIYNR